MGIRPLNQKLGIIGGGQLARMLLLAAAPLGVQVRVLCQSEDEPAAQVCGDVHLAKALTPSVLKAFSKGLTALTFESEFYDMNPFEKLQTRNKTLNIFPNPQAMGLLQDRALQKALLDHAKIPTADWCLAKSAPAYAELFKLFPEGFVLKKRRGGYDGYGTYFCRTLDEIKQIHLENLKTDELIAEKLVSFRRELSLVLTRSKEGSCQSLPLFETHQQQGRCDYVIGPANAKNSRAFKLLESKIKVLLRSLDYVGVIAFELFEDKNGHLFVNELAPRVHNSAHVSQQALSCSQFEAHIRVGLGLPLPRLDLLKPHFCMVNLIGSGRKNSSQTGNMTGTLHWYGKMESRAGRKMGHINYVGQESTARLLKKAQKERKGFKI